MPRRRSQRSQLNGCLFTLTIHCTETEIAPHTIPAKSNSNRISTTRPAVERAAFLPRKKRYSHQVPTRLIRGFSALMSCSLYQDRGIITTCDESDMGQKSHILDR